MKVYVCGVTLTALALVACGSRQSPPTETQPAVPAVLRPLIRNARTPMEKAAALLPWAAAQVVVGSPGVGRPHDLPTLLPIFQARTGGGSCGLFASFYQNVLTQVGIPAITLDLGFPGTPATHVTTLVWDHGAFYVFDPTYNGRFLDSSGRDVPLPVVLADHSLVIHEGPVTRGVVYPIGDIPDGKCSNVRPSSPTMKTCEMIVPANGAVLAAKAVHLDGDLVGAMLRTRVLAVTSDSTSEQRAALARILREAGIPNDIAS